MEYQFIDDPITGAAMAKFSLEHEVIGPWLEVEVGTSAEKLQQLLLAISDIEHEKQTEMVVRILEKYYCLGPSLFVNIKSGQ